MPVALLVPCRGSPHKECHHLLIKADSTTSLSLRVRCMDMAGNREGRRTSRRPSQVGEGLAATRHRGAPVHASAHFMNSFLDRHSYCQQ